MATHTSVLAWRVPGTGQTCSYALRAPSQMQFTWSGLFHHSWCCLVAQPPAPFLRVQGNKITRSAWGQMCPQRRGFCQPPMYKITWYFDHRGPWAEGGFYYSLGWLWRIKQEQRGAPCFPELGCTAFFSSSSVSTSTLIILIFFAPLHIPQPKPNNRRSKLERWCWERATHKHTLRSQHRLWVPNKWWVWAIQIKNVNMQCLEVYWPNW